MMIIKKGFKKTKKQNFYLTMQKPLFQKVVNRKFFFQKFKKKSKLKIIREKNRQLIK
jgi:hypothetical protein